MSRSGATPGGVIPIVAAAEPGARQCMPCTACCDGWVKIDVFDQPVYPGHPCPHSTGSSCRIYADRPVDPCINFRCGWVREDSHLPDWFRPNESGCIVLPAMWDWRTFPVDLALPVGPRIPQKALKWLMAYSTEHFRPLVYTEQVVDRRGQFTGRQEVRGFGPPTFQAEMQALVSSGRRLW